MASGFGLDHDQKHPGYYASSAWPVECGMYTIHTQRQKTIQNRGNSCTIPPLLQVVIDAKRSCPPHRLTYAKANGSLHLVAIAADGQSCSFKEALENFFYNAVVRILYLHRFFAFIAICRSTY